MVSIKQDDVITFKPEWSDPGDERFVFRAIQDEHDGRVLVIAELGLPFNPTHLVSVAMIATVNNIPIDR